MERNMDNDDKIVSKNEIHKKVMLFLGDELSSIHAHSVDKTYDIEKEYQKTKKNRSPFTFFILFCVFAVVAGSAFLINYVIHSKNEEIKVSLAEFESINLKSLLDTVAIAQAHYDDAVKNRSLIVGDMENKLKAAKSVLDNDIFVIDSMNISKKSVYNEKVKAAKRKYQKSVSDIHLEYDPQISAAEKEVEAYGSQLAEFDATKIESAREKEKALDSERQLRNLELRKMESQYEERISELNQKIIDIQRRSTQQIRESVGRVSKNYQEEIDKLDPNLSDRKATSIIEKTEITQTPDFDGAAGMNARYMSSKKVNAAVEKYQQLYDDYRYLDDQVAKIPQKNSIPKYVAAARTLVNGMGESFLDSTSDFYNETVLLNRKIDTLGNQIESLKQQKEEQKKEYESNFEKQKKDYESIFEKQKKEYESNFEKQKKDYESIFGKQKKDYESIFENMMNGTDTKAIVIQATDYENIKVYVSESARMTVKEKGAEGAEAELKNGDSIVKGFVVENEDGSFSFKVAKDEYGNLLPIDFSSIKKGSSVEFSVK